MARGLSQISGQGIGTAQAGWGIAFIGKAEARSRALGMGNIHFSSPAPTSPEGVPHRCFSPLSTYGSPPASPAHAPSALGDPSGSREMRVVTAAVQEGSLWTCAGCWADWKLQKDLDDQVLGRESQPSVFTTSQETSDRKTLLTKGPSNRVGVGEEAWGMVKAPNLLLLYPMKNEGGHVLTRWICGECNDNHGGSEELFQFII